MESSVNFTVAVCTNKFTLVDFDNDGAPLPPYPITDPEIFMLRVLMVELQGPLTLVIGTEDAPATFIRDSHVLQAVPRLFDVARIANSSSMPLRPGIPEFPAALGASPCFILPLMQLPGVMFPKR